MAQRESSRSSERRMRLRRRAKSGYFAGGGMSRHPPPPSKPRRLIHLTVYRMNPHTGTIIRAGPRLFVTGLVNVYDVAHSP